MSLVWFYLFNVKIVSVKYPKVDLRPSEKFFVNKNHYNCIENNIGDNNW